MPKQKITKEMVVDAAFSLARAGGMEQVLVKNIAKALHCSVQPIYSYCSSMEGLRREVYARVNSFVRSYVAERTDPTDRFAATGRAYVSLARQEPQIYKLFITQPRPPASSLEDVYAASADPTMARTIAADLGISPDEARRLHLHMLIYTIGLGTAFAASAPGIPAEEMLAQQERAYRAFLKDVMEEKQK